MAKPIVSNVFAIRSAEADRYVLEGELSFASVDTALKRTTQFFTHPVKTVFDLSGIVKADSAGLAILLEWLKRARLAGVELHYVNLPKQLLAMAQVAGIDSFFIIDNAND
jgi:phospholipid transport system transporter-binding protein